MDIAGAKALKERLGMERAQEAPSAAAPAEVPAEAPPVYHWTGVSKMPAEVSRADAEDTSPPATASRFSRLGLGFR